MFMFSVHLGPLGVAGLFILFFVVLMFIKLIWWLAGKPRPWPDVRRGYFLALGVVIALCAVLSLIGGA
jgi:hypothetical protein